MIETKEEKHILEAAFYEKPFHFSYSSLNRLLTAPNIFYKEYVLRQKEIKTEKYLIEGTLIHYLLLDNQAFDEKFLVTPEDIPSANSMEVLKRIFSLYEEKLAEDPMNAELELVDFSDEIMEALEEMNLHQKVGAEKRVAKIVEPRSEAYFTFLKKRGRREIIDSGILDKCARRADVLKADPLIRELLGMDLESDGVNYGVYNELPLKMELEGAPFGLRGILDNMVVDVKNKTIRINDFKTTGKSLVDFPDSVEYWNYWLQAAIYLLLAMEYLKAVIDDTWKFEIRFVVFDKYDQMYPFQVSGESLNTWLAKYKVVLEEARYHYEQRDYSLPYRFVAGGVTL